MACQTRFRYPPRSRAAPGRRPHLHDNTTERLYLLDGIGPFFRFAKGKRVNWSKVPFAALEENGVVRRELFREAIRADFARVADEAVRMGFNGITLDDLAHLTDCADYPPDLRARIAAYREEFAVLFDLAAERGLGVYLTSDVLFFHPALERRLGRSPARMRDFLAAACRNVLRDFPQVSGIILRIGEADGVDVRGDFHSRLVLRTPRMVRHFLQTLLPVFEAAGRRLVFRTWTVGAYRIGDLMWNPRTFDRVFRDLDSPALVLSLKYGESDFFRHLKLNPHFFRSQHRKIIELQGRREYEGCGKFPAWIGGDYESFRDALRAAPNVIGVQVWCQTGGWTKFRTLTFLRNSSLWNEVNTEAAIRLFREGVDRRTVARDFHARRVGTGDPEAFADFLELSEEIVRELLYIEEFASRELYFRRARVPTQLAVYWDTILVHDGVREILRHFVPDRAACVRRGHAALESMGLLREHARRAGLPDTSLDFMEDTFRIIAVAREYFFGPDPESVKPRLAGLKQAYHAQHKRPYAIQLDYARNRVPGGVLRLFLAMSVRERRGYRHLLDHLFTLRLLALAYRVMRHLPGPARLPAVARKRAMGLDAVFR